LFAGGISVELPPFVEAAIGAHAVSNTAKSNIHFVDIRISFPRRTSDLLGLFLKNCRPLVNQRAAKNYGVRVGYGVYVGMGVRDGVEVGVGVSVGK
jgi:hypothetical protein